MELDTSLPPLPGSLRRCKSIEVVEEVVLTGPAPEPTPILAGDAEHAEVVVAGVQTQAQTQPQPQPQQHADDGDEKEVLPVGVVTLWFLDDANTVLDPKPKLLGHAQVALPLEGGLEQIAEEALVFPVDHLPKEDRDRVREEGKQFMCGILGTMRWSLQTTLPVSVDYRYVAKQGMTMAIAIVDAAEAAAAAGAGAGVATPTDTGTGADIRADTPPAGKDTAEVQHAVVPGSVVPPGSLGEKKAAYKGLDPNPRLLFQSMWQKPEVVHGLPKHVAAVKAAQRKGHKVPTSRMTFLFD